MYLLVLLQGTHIECMIKTKKIPPTPAIKPAISLNVSFASKFLLSSPSFLPFHE